MKTFLIPLLSTLAPAASTQADAADAAGLDDLTASAIVDAFYGALAAAAPATVEQRLTPADGGAAR